MSPPSSSFDSNHQMTASAGDRWLSTLTPGAVTPLRSRHIPATARAMLALLSGLPQGELRLTTPDGEVRAFGRPDGEAPAAISVRDWRMAVDTMKRGDVGFAEGYIDGHWDTPDLTRLLTLLAQNRNALEEAVYGNGLVKLLLRLRHLWKANTRRQARRNILAHYDLGNDFYRLWLDPTMTYSAGLFSGDVARTLEQAQLAKYQRILRELALPAGSHILEIGCGWGAFAEVAARAGYRVTGLSLSDAQTAYARERMATLGLAERVTLKVQDYRDEDGRYDGVVSIEMFEAVGERWWPAYFGRVRDALVDGGRACIQAITIAEPVFDRYRRDTDFIQQHVFPGGMLASRARFLDEARRAGLAHESDLRFGKDYAATLQAWMRAFEARLPQVRALGFDERFARCWRFYLAYCTAGFVTGTTDVGQYTFTRG